MNKKGFTLIELLAVIVILAVVMLIGTISVNNVKLRIDKNMFEEKLGSIVTAAKNYGADNKSLIKESKFPPAPSLAGYTNMKYVLVSVYDLIKADYLTTDEATEASNLYNPSNCISSSKGCKTVLHYADGSSIDNLKLVVYLANNVRAYACIPVDSSYGSVATNNLIILQESCTGSGASLTCEEFEASNLYCK